MFKKAKTKESQEETIDLKKVKTKKEKVKKTKTFTNEDANSYKWWRDSKMIGTILLIISVIMIVFTFVKVPFFSTITAYTVGMMLGFYAPLFYLFIIYKSLMMIFKEKLTLPKWLRFTDVTYWLLVVSIVFLSTSLGYYQSKNGFTTWGTETWGSFNSWYDVFTDNEHASGWTPDNTNGGLIGAFIYSFTAMATTGIGALILAIIAIFTTTSLLISGSFWGFYKDMIAKRKEKLKEKEIKYKENAKMDKFDLKTKDDASEYDVIKEKENAKIKNMDDKNDKKSDSLPFDNPF